MLRKIPFIFLAFILAACTPNPLPASTPTPSAGQIDLEQQAVYAALLQNLYTSTNYVIMDTTATSPGGVGQPDSTLAYILQNLPGILSETTGSFRERNTASHPVSPRMALGTPYVLLTQDEMNQIFSPNQDGWQIFYERYPQAPGITTLSQVGFNNSFDQALVYVGTMSHWLAGAGYYVLLSKVNGAWVVDKKAMSWIS
jgi:hypothetical protein